MRRVLAATWCSNSVPGDGSGPPPSSSNVYLREYKADLVARFDGDCVPGFQGTRPVLRPVVDSVFEAQDIGAAHQKMEDNKNSGKIVIRF